MIGMILVSKRGGDRFIVATPLRTAPRNER
jgi:hypothetical protein